MKTNFVNNVVKAANRAAFFLSILVVIVLTFSVLLGCACLLCFFVDVFGITSIAARVVFSFLFLLGPAFEVVMNIEANALAVVARLFPVFFHCRRPAFEFCSFWARAICGFK